MNASRKCTKTGCSEFAVATLTYAYADRAIVVGPLATYAEPHSYDLCDNHATRLTAPQGWQVVRLDADGYEPAPVHDDLLAVVDAVRETRAQPPTQPTQEPLVVPGERRRGHLRVLGGFDEV